MQNSSNSPRILVLDSDRPCAQRLGAVLRDAGYTSVSVCTKTSQALRECAAAMPDLIVVDPCMKSGCGYSFLETLQTQTGGGHQMPRLLMVTADASDGPRIQAALLGVTEIVEKPCSMEAALAAVRRVLDPHSAPAAGPASSARLSNGL